MESSRTLVGSTNRFHRKPQHMLNHYFCWDDALLPSFQRAFSIAVRLYPKRWINLWWPAEVAKDIASDECAFEIGAGDIGALVFVGNLILVVGILLGVFLLHVAVVSGVEAYWLAKVRACWPWVALH